MKTRSNILIVMFALTFAAFCCGAEKSSEPEVLKKEIVYKKIDDVELKLHLFEMKSENKQRPAIVFFFGGGWTGGNPKQFFPHCEHFASLGMVAVSAEYRVKSRHGTTPFECVKDGKSAIRYVRAHAKELGIDPKKIIAAGGSAGGHVAACTGTIPGYEEKGEDTKISSKPNAMILFNPVADTTSLGFGASRFKGDPKELSPAHHITKEIVPTLIFHGTKDTTVPFENVERFTKFMAEAGNRCELMAFEGKKHGFFNYGRDKDNKSYNQTIERADKFIKSLDWLK